MEQKKDVMAKQEDKPEENVSRAQSQDALDTSSASSLSIFADHSDTQNGYSQDHEKSTDYQKSGDCSPRVQMDEALKSEKAFIEFVMSLPPKEISEHQHHRSTDSVTSKAAKSPTPVGGASSGSTATKVGLDHLDNLCKLMEQLSELRDTNNKLQRRVQYLEDLKTIHDMHKEISEETQRSPVTPKRRSYELKKSATETCCPKKEDRKTPHAPPGRSKYHHGRRGRTLSSDGERRERSKSVGHEDAGEDTKSKRIFPKWSKVKEAFGWESDRKDSMKTKGEGDAGSIQSPRRCSDDSHPAFHHSKSPTWSQDYPSLHSSLEDVREILDSGRWKRTSVVSEKNVMYLDTPKECLRRQKSTPSPGSEKLMSRTEASDLKPKSSTIERDYYNPPDYSKDDSKRGKSPWGRVKTIIERRRDSLKRRSVRRDHACADCDPGSQKKVPEVAEIKSYADYVESTVRQPVISDLHKPKNYAPDPIVIDEETDYNGPRTPSSSPTFHRKSRWTRVKKALKGKKEDDREPPLSTPASPNSGLDGHFPFDVIEEIAQDAYDDGREIKRVGSDSHVHQLSAPNCDLMLQLQRNLSEDFHRKIMEWERMRSSPHWDHHRRKPSVTIRSRKKSERDVDNSTKGGGGGIKPNKLKDLTWLEKELQKIEKEKQRLTKEKQKYEERALRLEKLKETVLSAKNSNKREVFVRTSAGEFRFEGISDAFTKKLYEWETKRGVGPELSTIALLDSSHLTVQPNLGPKSGPLQRVVSRSESSLADMGGQPSHNSSNSLPSLKIPDTMDADRPPQPSRANSEPDLSTLVALTNGSNVSVTNLSRQVVDPLDDEITSPGVSRESEEDELEKKRNDSETYYSLLEENVILLEQLKDKEEICGRLEKELEVLDKKVELMNEHHTQETELYREKLWEMHKPGATPRDVQCCLLTMSQLRKRIETLEKCTEKLRNDRESVEDRFRYHSKQQEDMTLDLLQKMSELQAAGSSTADCEAREYIPPRINVSAVEKLQDLSALLVKQTQELQETLSAKTRQICQLRWELLHRDLSTVKLETELHTHTAHRKRSKYAHYRSHSSEEAPVVPLPQELECGKSTIITDAYYNVNPENEFQATELTNTVQQLNRELLKLASATEHSQDHNHYEDHRPKSNNEKSWVKVGSQPRITDRSKQITVRRSSADSISGALGKEEGWKQKDSSSDSDSSSDEGYTKICFRPNARSNYVFNSNAERLLMSSGEHPPRGYLQRRKKLQKPKTSSSPNRRRSNTFHNKRDFEKPVVCENVPQKCNSFRLPTERNFTSASSRNNLDSVNMKNLLGEVRYREFLKKKALLSRNSNDQMQIPMNIDLKNQCNSRTDGQCLRASDSKIPNLLQFQHRTSDQCLSRHFNKYPVRSLSDKHAKEAAAERRGNLQQRKNKKHLTSPDLFANMSESLRARILAKTSQEIVHKDEEARHNFNTRSSSPVKSQYSNKFVFPSNIPQGNSDSTVTIQLPKRKSRKTQPRVVQDSSDNNEQTFTITIPKKRSLSSDQELECVLKNNANLVEKSVESGISETYKNCSENSKPYEEANSLNHPKTHPMMQFTDFPVNDKTENERFQTEQTSSRKRKAEDGESLSKNLPEIRSSTFSGHDDLNRSIQDTVTSNVPTTCATSYVKSSSVPHMDWRKVCAKKVLREGSPNVRSLIEKYNKVAESLTTKSANSSNLSSPTWNRKISAPLNTSKSDCVITPHSFSTPTTPSVISACTFYNPLVFKPINLDLFPRSAPESPLSAARTEAIKRAKEQFISSYNTLPAYSKNQLASSTTISNSTEINEAKAKNNSPSSLSVPKKQNNEESKCADDDRLSNCSMDSTNLVMYRTGETCQESRFSKRSVEYSRTEPDILEQRNNLKTSKSLSNSSIFKSVLNSDFKMPSTLLRLKRSKKKKDMSTVSQLCRQSLLLTTEDTANVTTPKSTHKSCPSSPELKTKNEVKPNWFHRNIFRHK